MTERGLLAKLQRGGFALERPNTTISLLRHANAVAANGGKDYDRTLSPKGKQQCVAGRETFKRLSWNKALRSPVPRVQETLSALGWGSKPVPQLVVMPNSDSRQSGILDTAYDVLGNVGLADILRHNEVRGAMELWAASAMEAVYAEIAQTEGWKDPGICIDILLAGHAWFSPFLAYYFAGLNASARHNLLFNPMQECELLRVGVGPHPEDLIWERIPCGA